MKKLSSKLIFVAVALIIYAVALYFSTKYPDKLGDVSVKIYGYKGSGSGVVIKSTDKYSLILTNRHVCQMFVGEDPIDRLAFVIGANKKKYEASVHKISNNTTDLCLMKTTEVNLSVADIGSKTVQGEKVFNHSAPLGIVGYKAEGYVGSNMKLSMGINVIQVSTPVYPGSSGSGIFNTSGELVGLICAGIPGASTISFAIPLSEEIEPFIQGEL